MKDIKTSNQKSENNGKHYNDVSCSLKVLRLSCCVRARWEKSNMKRTEKVDHERFPIPHSRARGSRRRNKRGLCQQCQNMWIKKQNVKQQTTKNSTRNGVS